MDFSETIAACDLKGMWVLKIKVISWPWPKIIYIWKLKLAFLRNHWTILNQILYVSFQVQGNENLLTWCWSHDQDGRHAHIWYKPFKNLLLRNQWTNFHETWYVASGTRAYHRLLKWWPSVDLDLFCGKVKLCNLGFSIGKVKTVDFF